MTNAKWTEMRGDSTLTMRTEHEHGGRDGAWNTEGPMRMSRRVRCLNVMEDQYQRSAEWWRMTVDMENTRFRDQKDPDPYTGYFDMVVNTSIALPLTFIKTMPLFYT